MPAARFCSECGQRLKVKRVSRLPFGSFCARCSPRFERARLILIAALVSCAAIGFAIGRYGASREPFYFIGTPIKLNASGMTPLPDDTAAGPSRAEALAPKEQPVTWAIAPDGICGARTKSGKLCQRRVKGGGYCYQHRGKAGENRPARPNH